MPQKRLLRPVVLIAALLLLGFNTMNYLWEQIRFAFGIGSAPAFDPQEPLDPPSLTSISHIIQLITIGLVVLLLLLAHRKRREVQISRRWWWYWLAGLGAVLLMTAAINIVVNPRNLYGTLWFPPRQDNFLSPKLDDYDAFAQTPDLLLIGSSHFLEIPTTYIAQTLGYRTFNFAVPGAEFDDLIPILNYQAAHNKLAPVILMDIFPILTESDPGAFIEAPVRLLPYAPEWQIQSYLGTRLGQLVQTSQLAESFYVLRHNMDATTWVWFLFDPDGGPGRSIAVSSSDFQAGVSLDIAAQKFQVEDSDYNNCLQQQQPDLNKVDQLVDWAKQNQSSIVFVMTPLEQDYYAQTITAYPPLVTCVRTAQEHLTALAQQNPNIFFENRVDPTSFTAELDYRGFRDGIHMNTFNSERFVDAIAPTLQAAMRVATQERDLPLPVPPPLPNHLDVSLDSSVVGWGWYAAEPLAEDQFFRWSGPENQSTVEALISTAHPLQADFCISAAANPQVLNSLRISANDTPLQVTPIRQAGCPFAYSAVLSESLLSKQPNRVLFSFQVDQTVTASSEDSRQIGIALRDIALTPITALTQTLSFGDSFSGKNVYAVEHDNTGNPFRWTGPALETDAQVSKLDEGAVNVSLCLSAAISADVLNSLQLEANGQVIPLTRASGSGCNLLYAGRMPAQVTALQSDAIHFALRVDHTTAPAALDSASPDHRLLGVALRWLRVDYDSSPSR